MTEIAATEVHSGEAGIVGFEPGTEGITPPIDPARRGVFLTDVIVELGFADNEQVEVADRVARESERSIERVLVENGTLDEQQLARAVAERNGLDHVDLDSFDVDMGAAEQIGRSMAERYEAVPIAFAADGALFVAVKDVFDTLGISDIEVLTCSEVRRVIATPSQLQSLIQRLPAELPAPPPVLELIEEPEPESAPEPEEVPQMETDATPDRSETMSEFEPPEPPQAMPEPPHAMPEPPQLIRQMEEAPQDYFSAPPPPPPSQDSDQEPEPEPEPEDLGPAPTEPVVPSDDELTDLAAELRALRDTASRADALALRVGDRIEALEGAEERADRLEREQAERDDRIAQLQRDLDAAKATSDELEGRLAGVGDAATELNAATETLRELQRALEQTAR